MRVLLVEPLEAPVFSRTPITSHEFIVGVHRAQPIPPPTTIAGMLGSALGLTLGGRAGAHIEAFEALLREFENAGCRKPVVKGPLLWFRKLGDRAYLCLGDAVVPLDVVERVAEEVRKAVKGGELVCDDCVKVVSEEAVGVKLERGYRGAVEKVVDKGYMYRYSTVRYVTISEGEAVTPTYVYWLNCDKISIPRIHRVGGEDRISLVNITSREDLPGEVARTLELLASPLDVEGEGPYMLLTQAPLIPVGVEEELTLDPESFTRIAGLEFIRGVEGVKGMVAIEVEDGLKGKLKWRLKRRVERLNLGYSEALKARRPQVLALPVGTIVETRRLEPRNVNRVAELLWSIGLASLLKL
jgi:CRISPR-associated protein Cmr3